MRKKRDKEATIKVRVSPRSSRRGVKVSDEGLLVSVTAPPAEGKANKMVLELVAKWLRIPKSRLSIAAGEHHKEKVILLAGITSDELARKLEDARNR